MEYFSGKIHFQFILNRDEIFRVWFCLKDTPKFLFLFFCQIKSKTKIP